MLASPTAYWWGPSLVFEWVASHLGQTLYCCFRIRCWLKHIYELQERRVHLSTGRPGYKTPLIPSSSFSTHYRDWWGQWELVDSWPLFRVLPSDAQIFGSDIRYQLYWPISVSGILYLVIKINWMMTKLYVKLAFDTGIGRYQYQLLEHSQSRALDHHYCLQQHKLWQWFIPITSRLVGVNDRLSLASRHQSISGHARTFCTGMTWIHRLMSWYVGNKCPIKSDFCTDTVATNRGMRRLLILTVSWKSSNVKEG